MLGEKFEFDFKTGGVRSEEEEEAGAALLGPRMGVVLGVLTCAPSTRTSSRGVRQPQDA